MRALALVVVGMLLMSGCGSEQMKDEDVQGSADGPLAGRFVVTDMTEQGRVRKPVAETSILLEFADDNLTVSAGCNTLFGAFSQDGDTLQIDALGGTQMGCLPELMEQDTWLAGVLQGTVRIDRSEGLRLIAGGVDLDLLPHTVRNRDLVGTSWRLESMIQGQGVSSVPRDTTARIELGDDGRLTVDTGCNTGSATATVRGATLEVGPLMLTRMACRDKDARAVEAMFLDVFDVTPSFTIEGDALTLSIPGRGLGFTAE